MLQAVEDLPVLTWPFVSSSDEFLEEELYKLAHTFTLTTGVI